MERFDDKNILKWGFLCHFWCTYRGLKKKSCGELFMLQALGWFTVVQCHKIGCFCFFCALQLKDGGRLFFRDFAEGIGKLSTCSWFILSLRRSASALFCYFASEELESQEIGLGCFIFLLFCLLSLPFLLFFNPPFSQSQLCCWVPAP